MKPVASQTVEADIPGVGVAPAHGDGHVPVDARLFFAIAAVWLLWGSTFAAMRFAVATIPPFPMASLRFTIAGLILYAICALRGRARVRRADIVRGAVTGATLLLLGNGVTAWTIQYLPTGLNALLLSLVPIWMALIAFVWGGERPTRLAIGGMLIGFAGLTLLVWQPHTSLVFPLWPTVLALLASIAWAFGSIYQRRTGKVDNVLLSTALQMLWGGGLIAIEAALFGQWGQLDVRTISPTSFAGLAWLIVFGSLLGYSAYLYTMQMRDAALASAYAYVNPVVAVIIGIVAFHERFTPLEAIAGAIILAGVALMIVRPAPARATTAKPIAARA